MNIHKELNYAARERLRYVESVLLFSGRINTGSIMAFFGVSRPTALESIYTYNQLLGNNDMPYKQGHDFVIPVDKSIFTDEAHDDTEQD